MEIHLKIIGVLFVTLALMHIGFPKYFKWKEELSSLSVMNRQMMYIHSFFIALFVLFNGLFCLFCSNDLIVTQLGKIVCLGLGLFWLIRLFFQLFGYSSQIWKGKVFETTIHILFAILWSYISFVFLYIGL